MLLGRIFSYADAHRARIGVNYKQIPVNRPKVPVHSYSKEGLMRVQNVSDPVYAPNSKGAMASLLFTCPNTNRRAPIGIETDVQSLRAAWNSTVRIHCSYCGKVHEISVRETYINGALQDAVDRGSSKSPRLISSSR